MTDSDREPGCAVGGRFPDLLPTPAPEGLDLRRPPAPGWPWPKLGEAGSRDPVGEARRALAEIAPRTYHRDGGPPRKHPELRPGDRFGDLEVVRQVERDATCNERVLVRCPFGHEQKSYAFNLRRLTVRCSGCQRHPNAPPIPYDARRTYRVGERVAHLKFGIGAVERVRDGGAIEVRFGDEPRVLVHGRR